MYPGTVTVQHSTEHNLVFRDLSRNTLDRNEAVTSSSDSRAAIRLCPAFRDLAAPGTGRRVVQLTEGEGWTYPLYFFIPSFTRDDRYLVYHRAERGELQLHRLELATGESRQLTFAHCTDTQWRPWCVDSGRGCARSS